MTQYQFMYGPAFLVALFTETKTDDKGSDIRNGIYLPKGQWIDYLTGEQYEGGQIINSFDSPIWKLPVFVKRGAIIPLVNPNNNVSEINKIFVFMKYILWVKLHLQNMMMMEYPSSIKLVKALQQLLNLI